MKQLTLPLTLVFLLGACGGGGTPAVQGDVLNWPSTATGTISIVSKQDANVVFASQSGFKSDSKITSFATLTAPTDPQLVSLGFVCQAGYTLESTLSPSSFTGLYGLGRYSHPKSDTDPTMVKGNLGLFNSDPTVELKTGDQQGVWVFVKTDITLEGEVKCKTGDATVHDLTQRFSYTVNNQTQKTTLKAGWNLLISTVEKFVETEKEVIYRYSAIQTLPASIRWYYLP
jgi:hypothetical protein